MSSRPLPVGTWLIHDPEDDTGLDYSVWRRDPTARPGAELIVGWFGDLEPRRGVDYMLPERMIWVRITDVQLVQLTMAAAHGVFRSVAQAMWARIMT